jgi:LAS superfamily LD-carboxypeptidase LdcB
VTQPHSLDDKLKQASLDKAVAEVDKLRREAAAVDRQAEKTQAETDKLRCEASVIDRQAKSARLIEPLKLFGAAVLGIGGVVAAVTQYEVAELRAKDAQLEKSRAEKARDDAESAASQAIGRQRQADLKVAEATRVSQQAEAAASAATARAEQAQKELVAIRASVEQTKKLHDAAVLEQARLQQSIEAMKDELNQTSAKLASAKTETAEARSKLGKEVLEGLQPAAKDLALKLIEKAREQGLQLRLIAGYRSPEQQAALFAQGRTTPGPIVTNARVSIHNTGLAFDIAVVKDGKLEFDDKALYAQVGAIGKELGLIWGGDYTGSKDLPHFETSDAKSALQALKAGSSG